MLGSVLASAYAAGMDGAAAGLPGDAAAAASDSVGAAHAVAAQLGGSGATSSPPRTQAFIDAMATTAGIAAAIAIVGALIAAVFLPARARRGPRAGSGVLPEPVAA